MNVVDILLFSVSIKLLNIVKYQKHDIQIKVEYYY